MPRAARSMLAALALASAAAAAQDFRSIAAPALMYDAPSARAMPRFIIAPSTPVEVVIGTDGWVKVRDAAGDLAWVERARLSERRTLLVTAPSAEIRAAADAAAAVVFVAERDVVLDYLESGPAGWVRVRHRDGPSGFVRVTQVWGL